MFEEADLIHRYTRAQALADGVLIDVSETAKEAGFKYPVALTAAAWARCVAVPPGVACQDEAGRLWDVLYLLRCAVGRSAGGPEVRFGVHVRNDNRERIPPLVGLKALALPFLVQSISAQHSVEGPATPDVVRALHRSFPNGRPSRLDCDSRE